MGTRFKTRRRLSHNLTESGEDDYEVADFDFWLKKPCQPDICKDFKHN